MTEDRDGQTGALTPVQRRRIESSLEIHDSPTERIAYQHTVLCQTCLPYRNPGDQVREWEREQGKVSLLVEAGRARHPETKEWVKLGLPFGPKPRLILAYLNGVAMRSGSPVVEVEDSLTAFVRRLGIDTNGRNLRLLKGQLARLSAATVRLAVGHGDRSLQVNTQIVTAFDLWFPKDDRQRVLWPTTVRLSQEYFDSLTRHAVPLDERAIAALAQSAMALDVYAWLAQRLHRVPKERPHFIPWAVLHQQFGQGYDRLRAFRTTFLRVLRTVQSQYPAARVEANGQGMTLRNSPPPVGSRMLAVDS
jgi:hypothetical protein